MRPNTGGFDVMFQARQEVVNAVLVSILNQLHASNTSSSIAAKTIIVPILGDGTVDEHGDLLSLTWHDPQVTLGTDGDLRLTLTVDGGDHLSQTAPPAPGTGGRIMTLSGQSPLRLQPHMRPTASPPGLGLNPVSLDVSAIVRNLSYAGFGLSSTDFATGAAAIQTSIENTFSGVITPLLRGSIASAQMPLAAFGLSLLGSGVITCAPESMGVHVFADRFAMGGSIPRAGNVLPPIGQPALMQDMLAAHPDSNVAITLTQDGLNAHLARALADGSLSPTFTNPSDGTPFRVNHLQVDLLSDGTTQAHSHITRSDGLGADLNMTIVYSGPDAAHQLTPIRRHSDEGILSGFIDPSLNWDQLWPAVMGWMFGSLFHPSGTSGTIDLTQSFSIPGISMPLTGPLTHLDVTDGALTVYCAMPTDAVFHAAPLAAIPAVVISQPDPEPVQDNDCMISTQLHAEPVSAAISPTDVAWELVGRSSTGAMLSNHTDTITVNERAPVAARVWMIDRFGRHTTNAHDVAYVANENCAGPATLPSDPDRRRPPIKDIRPDPAPGRALRVLVTALLIGLVILGIGIGVWALMTFTR
jgi:hypothetical protein